MYLIERVKDYFYLRKEKRRIQEEALWLEARRKKAEATLKELMDSYDRTQYDLTVTDIRGILCQAQNTK